MSSSMERAWDRFRYVSHGDRTIQALVFVSVLILLPVLLPILFLLRVYRDILKTLIRHDMGEDTLMVSGDDAVWLQDTKENRAVINSLFVLQGNVDIDAYRERIRTKMVEAMHPRNKTRRLFPKVTCYPSKFLHRYVWVQDENFDLNDHVVVHPEPCPSDKLELETMVSRLCSAPLPANKPAWKITILQPPEGDPMHGKNHFMVFRVHHAIADGISLVRMFLDRLVDETPKAAGKARFGSKNYIWKLLQAVVEGPALLLARFMNPEDINLLHGPAVSGIKHFAWSEPIDLELVKKIKNATHTTVNDVVMSCLGSTFRSYHKRYATKIPKGILSYVPVDIRSPKSDITLDNQFGVVMLDLPIDKDDPLEILKATKNLMDKVKASPEPLVNALVIKYMMNRLPNWMTDRVFSWIAAKATLVLSNVPGPNDQLKFAGHAMDAIIFWPPQKRNVGLAVSIFSYHGSVRIGVTTDKNVLTNPSILVNEFVDKVHDLAKRLNIE